MRRGRPGLVDVGPLKDSLKLGVFEMQGETGDDERGVEQRESAKLGAGTQVEGVGELDMSWLRPFLMGSDAMVDGGVVALEDASDLEEAVMTRRVDSDARPELMTRAADATRAALAQDLVGVDAAFCTNLLEEWNESA